MITVKATLIGIRPLLMDRMSDATLESLRTGVRKPEPKDVPAEDIARKKIYTDEDGNVGLPAQMLFSCMVVAGRKVKNGKYQISTAESSSLPALLDIEEDFLVFNGHADKKWEVSKDLGRLQNGTAVCITRPKFLKWGFDVTLEIDESEVSEETIKQLVAVAGKKFGLGAWRPGCKGRFGTFKIASWNSDRKSGKEKLDSPSEK